MSPLHAPLPSLNVWHAHSAYKGGHWEAPRSAQATPLVSGSAADLASGRNSAVGSGSLLSPGTAYSEAYSAARADSSSSSAAAASLLERVRPIPHKALPGALHRPTPSTGHGVAAEPTRRPCGKPPPAPLAPRLQEARHRALSEKTAGNEPAAAKGPASAELQEEVAAHARRQRAGMGRRELRWLGPGQHLQQMARVDAAHASAVAAKMKRIDALEHLHEPPGDAPVHGLDAAGARAAALRFRNGSEPAPFDATAAHLEPYLRHLMEKTKQ